MFNQLMKEAQKLGAKTNTEWAESHENVYNAFDEKIKAAYNGGEITAHEFNELACTAFYDYFDLIEEYTGTHYAGEIVMHNGHECKITATWNDDGKNGVSIIPTGGYGFEVDIYEELL